MPYNFNAFSKDTLIDWLDELYSDDFNESPAQRYEAIQNEINIWCWHLQEMGKDPATYIYDENDFEDDE